MTTPPPSFRNCCSAEIHCDESGEECALTVSCDIRDRLTGEELTFEKTVDLKPLTTLILHQLQAMHAAEHGDVEVSGLMSFLHKAKDAAKRIATSSAVKAVYEKVAKVAIKEVPGGETAMALATATYDTVSKARQGDKKALAKIKATAKAALQGDPLANQVMATAKTLNTLQAAKEAKNPLDMSNRVAAIEAILNPLWHPPKTAPGGVQVGFSLSSLASKAKWAVPGYAAYRGAKALTHHSSRPTPRRGKAPVAPRRLGSAPGGVAVTEAPRRLADVQSAPPPPVEEAPLVLDAMADAMADDGYGEEEIAEAMDTTVAGWKQWLYSSPYRGPATAMLGGDFGAGMTLRSLYSNGLQSILARK